LGGGGLGLRGQAREEEGEGEEARWVVGVQGVWLRILGEGLVPVLSS